MISPTPPEKLVDGANRPYFLWDMDLTIDEFREKLRDSDDATRAWFLGKLMREAKPDDVFLFASREQIVASWECVEPHLGRMRPFWAWLVERLRLQGDARS